MMIHYNAWNSVAQRRLKIAGRISGRGQAKHRLPVFEALEKRLALTSILALDPMPNSHQVDVSKGVAVAFDEPIGESSVSDRTFVLHAMQSGQLLDPPNSIDSADNVVVFTPGFGIDYFPGELVQATVTAGIQSTAGQSSVPHVWHYRVKPGGGSGFFTDSAQSLGSATTHGVGLGDLDGDNDLDAIVSSTNGRQVWVNNGTGAFTLARSLGGTGTPRVVLGDLNGDGRLDAVAGNVYLNTGSFTFSVGQALEGTSLGDVDGDGDLDLLGDSIWFNDGRGNFTAGQVVGRGALGDLDADGDLDAFVIKSGTQGNQVWLNDGKGNFTNTGQSMGNSDSRVVSLGDVDLDGDLDAFVGNGANQADQIWLNNGTGLGFVESLQALGNVDTRAGELADLDGDGDLDLFITSVSSRVWLNDGAGNFATTGQTLNGGPARSVAVGDVDGDGDLDAWVGSEGDTPDRVWRNQQTPPATVDRFEPNDNSASARNLDTDPFHLSGQLHQVHAGLSIHRDTDVDWFSYTAPESGQMTVDVLFTHAIGDLDVELLDSSLNVLATEKTQTDNERILRTVTAGEKFFIRVFGFAGAVNPNYSLVILGSKYPPDVFIGKMGNDSRASAVDLGAASQVHDNLTIHNPGRNDWFKITAPARTGTINVSVLFDHARGDLDLRVLNRSGNEVASSETSTSNEEVSFMGTAGETYFIHVLGFEGATHPDYTLRIDSGNRPPTLTLIDDQVTREDTPRILSLSVDDDITPVNSLTLKGSSTNQNLVSDANILFAGTGAKRTVTLTPTANQSGTSVITLSVSDGQAGITQRSFLLTVEGVADVPNLKVVDVVGLEGTPIPLSIISTLHDTDGSESLTILVSDVPEGAALSAGINSGKGVWTLKSSELANLTITPAPNDSSSFNLTVTAIATEKGSNETALTSRSIQVSVDPIDNEPRISTITDQVINEDVSTGPIPFTITDIDTPGTQLTVTATSGDPILIPNSGIALGGSGELRTITINPALNENGGPVTVTIRVSDGINTVESKFAVTVRAVNDPPTISNIADQTIGQNTSTGLIPFTIGDVESGPALLQISATSNNQALVSDNAIALTGTGAERNIMVRPALNQIGSATIQVIVRDGDGQSATETFDLTVVQVNSPPRITSPEAVSVPENTTTVLTVTATDSDGEVSRFLITGGADQAAFAINSITGALSFGSAKLLSRPEDANRDNIYEVIVTADDGNRGTADQLIRVTVVDVVAPSVRIVQVTPDPRAGAVETIHFVFSEPVTGLDRGDLRITRSASSTVDLSLTGSTLSSTDNITWTLGNLRGLTSGSGIYELTLTAADSEIRDRGGVALESGDAISWTNGPGDADENGSFSQFDLIAVLQGGKYLTGQPATWREGDWNGDGVFDQGDIIAALQPNYYLRGPLQALATSSGSQMRLTASVDAVMAEL